MLEPWRPGASWTPRLVLVVSGKPLYSRVILQCSRVPWRDENNFKYVYSLGQRKKTAADFQLKQGRTSKRATSNSENSRIASNSRSTIASAGIRQQQKKRSNSINASYSMSASQSMNASNTRHNSNSRSARTQARKWTPTTSGMPTVKIKLNNNFTNT